MNDSFWSNIYDAVKDRRYGSLFFSTFFVVIGLFLLSVVLGGMTASVDVRAYLIPVLIGIGVFILVLGWRLLRRARRRRREQLKFAALSRDEMNKARSKLMKSKLKL